MLLPNGNRYRSMWHIAHSIIAVCRHHAEAPLFDSILSNKNATSQAVYTPTCFEASDMLCASFRKALKEESRDAIEIAFSTARATCMQEHCARRNLAQHSLEQFKTLMDMDVNQLPHILQNIMAALSYGITEVLWYFRKVNEVLQPVDMQCCVRI